MPNTNATNWDSVAPWQRVLAAAYASGHKLDLKEMAKYYGTTYHTLENALRPIKKLSHQLKEEVETGERGEVAPVRTKSAPSTPRKPKTPKKDPLGAVANGRVTKASPSKKKGGIKQEQGDSSMSSFMDDPIDVGTTSFDAGTYSFGDEDMFS